MTTLALETVADHHQRVKDLRPDFIGNLLTLQYAGSTSHGTYIPASDPNHIDDVDILGVWLPSRQNLFGLHPVEHWAQFDHELDIVTYEVRKFAKLLLRGNPNVVGMLWAVNPPPIVTHPAWQAWIDNRRIFLSQRVYDSFSGYAYAQLKKLGKPNTRGYMGAERKELFATHGYDIKNASHCVRLLRMGIELLETGELNVNRTGIDAEELMEIKSGKWTLGQVQRAADQGFATMIAARDKGNLPKFPDEKAAEALVMATIETSL